MLQCAFLFSMLRLFLVAVAAAAALASATVGRMEGGAWGRAVAEAEAVLAKDCGKVCFHRYILGRAWGVSVRSECYLSISGVHRPPP